MTSTTDTFTPGETVEILLWDGEMSGFERGWTLATYVSRYAKNDWNRIADAHIVSCRIGDKVVSFSEIRKVA